MGRTLHFQVVNPKVITEAETEIIREISKFYNTGKYETTWTCENFYLDPHAYFPNWKYFQGRSATQAWEAIDKHYASIVESGKSHVEAIDHLRREGYINFLHEGEIRGFCKVGGNEQNAALVYSALILISRRTRAVISLSDEGFFLKVPVFIKQGKAKPWVERIHDDWGFWKEKGFLKDNRYGVADIKGAQESILAKNPDFTSPLRFCQEVDPGDFINRPGQSD